MNLTLMSSVFISSSLGQVARGLGDINSGFREAKSLGVVLIIFDHIIWFLFPHEGRREGRKEKHSGSFGFLL